MSKLSSPLAMTVGNVYYIRVTAESVSATPGLTGNNYTLTFTSSGGSNGGTSVTNFSGLTLSGGDSATYNGVTRYRVTGGNNIAVSGYAYNANGSGVSNEAITVTFENTNRNAG
jgi:hypothetical protein